jgi:hypothetical protein
MGQAKRPIILFVTIEIFAETQNVKIGNKLKSFEMYFISPW